MATKKTKVITKRDNLKLNAKDIGVRALKTFVQTFIASLGVVFGATNLEDQKAAFVVVLASSGASALSVVQNALLAVRDK